MAKRKKQSKGKSKRLRRIFWMNFRNFLVLGVVLVVIGGTGYFGVQKIISIKNNSDGASDDVFSLEDSEGDVIGIKDVPSFPGATFMFANTIDTDVVQKFLGGGKSAYLLPIDAEWEDVDSFYSDNLEEHGWSHVLSVELSDESRLYGEYWIKNDRGLRIYSKLDDVWYELITVEQATSGLSDRVAQNQEMEMYLAMNSGEELPEKFPWKLSFTSDWTTTLGKSKLLEIEYVQFDHSDGDQILVIEPIEFVTQQPLRDIGINYLETANEYRDEDDLWGVTSIDSQKIADQSAFIFYLESQEETGYYAVVANPENDVIYVIRTYTGSKAFFDYVISNLELNTEEED
jgi:hypothetical protein